MTRARLSSLAAFALAVLAPRAALYAQPASGEQTITAALFHEGRQLLGQGDTAAACPKFAESYRLEPALGTLLNLALCHEMQGRWASAWAEYNDAATEAQQTGQQMRHDFAREHAKRLEPKLAFVIVYVKTEVDGLKVRLDRTDIGRGAFGSPLPVDPGEHTLRAFAPGRREWSTTLHIAGVGAQAAIIIPPLQEVVESPPPPVLPRAEAPLALPKAPEPRPLPAKASAAPTFGVLLIATGAVGLGVSAGFGLRALSLKGQREAHCDGANACDRRGLAYDDDARDAARIATFAGATGAALTAAGVALLVFGPQSERSRGVELRPALGGVTLAGAF